MANKDIQVGNRVRLSEDTAWTIGSDNPIGILGTVIAVDAWVDVDWDNGGENAYLGCDEDLIVVECEE